jgi:hypothetical protein
MIEKKTEKQIIDKEIGNNMKDYRKKFKKHYGIDFDGQKYHIHHIDCNRENNDINNLMMLPKKLHQQYHFYKNIMDSYIDNGHFKFEMKIKNIFTNNVYENRMVEDLIKFIDIRNECSKWGDYKCYLNGEIYNIHNIKL